jgi:hypothetical protein
MKNFCSLEPGALQSECIADYLRDRKTCGFYKKSSQRDDCMYYVMSSFCDCLKAQTAETNIEEDEIVLEEHQRLLFYEQC